MPTFFTANHVLPSEDAALADRLLACPNRRRTALWRAMTRRIGCTFLYHLTRSVRNCQRPKQPILNEYSRNKARVWSLFSWVGAVGEDGTTARAWGVAVS